MNISNTHIIRQQYLHVEVNGTESDGMALQRTLPDLCQHWLMPALEQVLDRYAPAESHLIFERIEIDAGTFTLDRLERDFVESVAQAVEKILQEQSLSLGKNPVANASGNVQLKTSQQSIQDAFVYFLKTGSLPWSFSLPSGKNLEQVILDSWQDTKQSETSRHTLNATIVPAIAAEVVRKRLVRQFSPVFMGNLLVRLTLKNKKVLDGVLTVLQDAEVPSIEARQFERRLWETVFAAVAMGKSQTETSLVNETWRSLSADKIQHTALVNLLEQHWPGVIKNDFANQVESVEPASRKRIKTKKDQRIEPGTDHNIIDNQPEAKEASDKGSTKENKTAKQLSPELPVAKKKKNKSSQQPESKSTSAKGNSRKTKAGKQTSLEIPLAEEKKDKDSQQISPKNAADKDYVKKDKSVKSEKQIPPDIAVTEDAKVTSSKQPELKKIAIKGANQQTKTKKQELTKASVTKKKKSEETAEQPEVDEFDQSDIHTQQEVGQHINLENAQNQIDFENNLVDMQQGVYIDCAGLVLLHPFLSRFFEVLGIVSDDDIIQPDRALCLLHYLATGQTIAPEYELVLPKILCNVPLEMPVESAIELTPAELEEANALLEAVIHHWEVLRNTGVDGLRGTFLVRPGKVSEREDGDWQLQVESKSFDILLDQLPWGISAIKLPWMQRMLWVEWTN